MKGNISLKDFILGVKKELQDASAEGGKNPFLELNQVELEAVFGLETSGSVEGGFSVFVRADAKVDASQSHKVRLVFSPIRDNVMLSMAPADSPDQASGTLVDSLPGGATRSMVPEPPGRYFYTHRGLGFVPGFDVDEIVRKAVGEAMRTTKPKK